MKTFKQFIAEDAEITLDDIVEKIRSCHHIPCKPIFRGISGDIGNGIKEFFPRTTESDGEGRRSRDSKPDISNSFNIMMELNGEKPKFRQNTFNVVGTAETAKMYGEVCFVFFDSPATVYRMKHVADSGFADIRSEMHQIFDNDLVSQEKIKKAKNLDFVDADTHASIMKRLPSHKALEIVRKSQTLKELKDNISETDFKLSQFEEYFKQLNSGVFAISKFDIASVDKCSNSDHEAFVLGCKKYIVVGAKKVVNLLNVSKEQSTAARYTEAYNKLLQMIK